MKMNEIRILAKSRGVNSFGKTKRHLIHEIQIAEGNFPCFGRATDYCDQYQCAFRSLCLPQSGTSAVKSGTAKTAGGSSSKAGSDPVASESGVI